MVLVVEQDLVVVLKVVEIHLEQDFETVAAETVVVSEIAVETVVTDAEIDVQEVDELIDVKVDEVVDGVHEEVDVEIDEVVDAVDVMLDVVFDAQDTQMEQDLEEHNFLPVKLVVEHYLVDTFELKLMVY